MMPGARSLESRPVPSFEAGFTLIETIISSAILVLLLLAGITAELATTQSTMQEDAMSELDSRLWNTLNRMETEIANSGPSHMSVPSNGSSTTANFTQMVTVTAGVQTWDPAGPITYSLASVSGETLGQGVQWSQGSTSTIICDRIQTMTFYRSAATSTAVIVTLMGEALDPTTQWRTTIVVSHTATITMQNQ